MEPFRLATSMLLVGVIASASASASVGEAPGPVPTATSERGELRLDLAVTSTPGQSYDLYLPPGYPGTRHWPVLIILDPRGRTDWVLASARPGAEANGWLVLASHQSRSDDREQITLDALQALLREVGAHYAYEPGRVYVAGMSGTAKTLWVVDQQLPGLVAGYIGAGGGRPPELGAFRRPPPPYFGFAGNHDFNFQEMRVLDASLADAGGGHRLEVFAGQHGWSREPEALSAAIDWLELAAMRAGKAPVRDAWVDMRLQAERSAAAAGPSSLERARRYDQIARDYAGLREIAADRQAATRWLADEASQRELAREKKLREEELRFAKQFDDWATRFNQHTVDGTRQAPPALAPTLAELRLRSLRTRAAGADPIDADSATRRLERVYTAGAHYLADAQLRRGDRERASLALKLAQAAFPDRAWPRCRLAQIAASSLEVEFQGCVAKAEASEPVQ